MTKNIDNQTMKEKAERTTMHILNVSVHAFEHPRKVGVYLKSIYLCKKVIP